MMTLVRRLWSEDDGQDLIEYALLAAFIALAAIAGMTALGKGIDQMFKDVNTKIDVTP
jgi:pilus assembly protein Flp/PilA